MSEWPEFVAPLLVTGGILVAIAVFAVLSFRWIVRRQDDVQEAWKSFAEAHGLAFEVPKPERSPCVKGTYRDRPIRLRKDRDSNHTYVEYSVELPPEIPRFELYEQGLITLDDVDVGDERLDEAFIVDPNEEDEQDVREYLTRDDVSEALLELRDDLAGRGDVLIENHLLQYRNYGLFGSEDEERVRNTFDMLVDCADVLAEASSEQ